MQRPAGTGPIEAKRTPDQDMTGGAAAEHRPPILNGALPSSYGETRIILVPIDPYLVHAYWDVSDDDRAYVTALFREGSLLPQALLRFHDVTALPVGGVRAAGSFDVEVELGSRNWYVHLLSPEKAYIVDLGFRGTDGRFHRIARSNRVETPRAWPCGEAGEQSMHVIEVDGVLCMDFVAKLTPAPDRGFPTSGSGALPPLEAPRQEIPAPMRPAHGAESAAGAGDASEGRPTHRPRPLPETRYPEQPRPDPADGKAEEPILQGEAGRGRRSPLPPPRGGRGTEIRRVGLESVSGPSKKPRSVGGGVRLEGPRDAEGPPDRAGIDLCVQCEQGFLFGLSSGRIAAGLEAEAEDEG